MRISETGDRVMGCGAQCAYFLQVRPVWRSGESEIPESFSVKVYVRPPSPLKQSLFLPYLAFR